MATPIKYSVPGIGELAEVVGISPNTVYRFENGSDARQSTVTMLRVALEGAGAVFIDEDEHLGPGVRLRKAAEI